MLTDRSDSAALALTRAPLSLESEYLLPLIGLSLSKRSKDEDDHRENYVCVWSWVLDPLADQDLFASLRLFSDPDLSLIQTGIFPWAEALTTRSLPANIQA